MSKTKIKPVGQKLLVKEVSTDLVEKTVGKIEAVNTSTMKVEVVEVSEELKEKYHVGQKLIAPINSGISQVYKGKPHLWLNILRDEVWGIIEKEETTTA